MQKDEKLTLIEQYATHEGDTGSPEVQIALLTNRINNLTVHLKANKKDFELQNNIIRYLFFYRFLRFLQAGR